MSSSPSTFRAVDLAYATDEADWHSSWVGFHSGLSWQLMVVICLFSRGLGGVRCSTPETRLELLRQEFSTSVV